MKRTKQCPKCQSLRIGYLPDQPDANGLIAQPDAPELDPSTPVSSDPGLLAVRMVGVGKRHVFTGAFRHGKVTPLLGKLEAVVCTECGYYESYVANPPAVAWDNVEGFRWVNVPGEPAGPYR